MFVEKTPEAPFSRNPKLAGQKMPEAALTADKTSVVSAAKTADGGFVQPRPLPTAGVGDFLVLEAAGAYGQVMASNYNSKPLAAAVLLREQQRHLIRRRQTPADMWSDEQLLPSETRD